MLATIHVVVSLRLLIDGFIHTENVPDGAFFFWIDPALKGQIISKAVFVTNVSIFHSNIPFVINRAW